MLLLEEYISNFTCIRTYFLYVEFSNFYVNQSLAGQTIPMYVTNKGESIRKSAYVCCVDLQKVFDTVEVTDAFKICTTKTWSPKSNHDESKSNRRTNKQNIWGVFFLFHLKVCDEESIVNAPWITDQLFKYNLTFCVVCVFTVQTEWLVHNQLVNAKFKKTPVMCYVMQMMLY
jgi:hypothetical protein